MPLNRDRRIRLAFILTAGILAVELVAFAFRQAVCPATPRKTFGYQRVGILVALINALLLGAIVLGIVIEAVRRLQHPAAVQGGLMSIAALLALAISLFIARSLRPLAADLTVRSVLVHVWGDAGAAAAVVAGGLVIIATGWTPVDPILSLAIAGLIAWSAWKVLAAAVDILLEATPPDLDL